MDLFCFCTSGSKVLAFVFRRLLARTQFLFLNHPAFTLRTTVEALFCFWKVYCVKSLLQNAVRLLRCRLEGNTPAVFFTGFKIWMRHFYLYWQFKVHIVPLHGFCCWESQCGVAGRVLGWDSGELGSYSHLIMETYRGVAAVNHPLNTSQTSKTVLELF